MDEQNNPAESGPDTTPDTDGLTAQDSYQRASIKTAGELHTVARQVSHLTLPEIDAAVDVVSRMIPAGNVPGVILSSLAGMAGRKPPRDRLKRDVNLLFQGVEKLLDKAVFGTFFAGPAAVIWGYQNLLKMAGKDPDAAFEPEGTWQFYVDYALREDTARHANETHGFDTVLKEHGVELARVDRITAWVMTAIDTLHQYNSLLLNEWRERTQTYALREIVAEREDGDPLEGLYKKWVTQRPYHRGEDAQGDTYAQYRQRKFDAFMADAVGGVSPTARSEWQSRNQMGYKQSLPDYLMQMTIHAYLQPETYGEVRTSVPLEQLRVGVIIDGHYYLLPVCKRNTNQRPDIEVVRRRIAAILATPRPAPEVNLADLATIRRTELAKVRPKLNDDLIQSLDALQAAPILLNFDVCSRDLPLAEIRQGERGVGDHALTLFDTGESIIFDQSHIFFDGAWGVALAEIMTGEALSWAVHLSYMTPARPGNKVPTPLPIHLEKSDLKHTRKLHRVMPEINVENDAVEIKRLMRLRRLFKQRSDLLQLTVNDVLVLFRSIHALIYQPPEALLEELQWVSKSRGQRKASQAAEVILAEISNVGGYNPAILIPVDATPRSPRDRLYPMTFTVPLEDLDLISLHRQVVAALDTYENEAGDRTQAYEEFDRLQRQYLSTLAAFGQIMSRAKEIAIAGESASVGSIKLLGHMPRALQRFLDSVPSRFEMLNDIIKGREVFSNVGAVAEDSTLTRFLTAKDDNEKKTLAWGVLTDASSVMRVSLRDFRPHVGPFVAAGQGELAHWIAKDYLDAYADGLNDYIRAVWRITLASRETQLQRPPE
jgi:hypothetical protein